MISVILPVYNPGEGWAANALAEVLYLERSMPDIQFEFIMVNDGSDSDIYSREKNQIAASQIQLIEYMPNQGKGEALRTGVMTARGEWVVYTDIDFPYTQHSIAAVIAALRSGISDVVIGIKDKDYYDHVPGFRRFASRLLRSVVRRFFRIPTDDFMCGLKGFNARGREVFLQTTIDRYLFDLDFMVLLAGRKDIRTETLEVHLRDNIKFRDMNPTLILFELRDLVRIWLRR